MALSESGIPSSKRIAFFLLLLVFLFLVVLNTFTGKKPDVTLQDQLYYMLTTLAGLVFGSNVLNKIADVKKTQSENNTKVGSPSPTPDTTVIKQ